MRLSDIQAVLERSQGLLLGDGHEQALREVSALKDRLAAGQVQVLVMGEFKRGKSTLINALVGRPLLPMGAVPLTSIVTVVRRAERESATVAYLDGRREAIPVECVRDFVAEEQNPKNRKKVDHVAVGLPSSFLREGMLLVDTPGVGSVYRHNTEVAQRYLPNADAVILVLTADPPISQSEVEFLHSVRRWAKKLYVVLNKTDYLSGADLEKAVTFTRQVVRDALESPQARIHALSAKRALESRLKAQSDAGTGSDFEELASALDRLAFDEREGVVFASILSRCAELLRAVDLGFELELKALTTVAGDLEARIAGLNRSLESIKRKQYEADKLFSAELKDHVAAMEEALYEYAKKEQQRITEGLAKLYEGLHREPAAVVREKLNRAFMEAVEESYSRYLTREEPSWAVSFQAMTDRYLGDTLALANQALKDAAGVFGVEPRTLGKPAVSVKAPAVWFVLEEVSIWAFDFLSLPTLRLFKPFFWKAMRGKVHEAMDINAGRMRYDYSRRIEQAAEGVRRSIQVFFQSAIEDVQKAAAAVAIRKIESEESLRKRIARLNEQRLGIRGILEGMEVL
jgi:predicted GTPase